MAWDAGHRRVLLEMDSLVLLNMIKDHWQQSRFVPMLFRIAELLNREWEVVVKHAYREANCCADRLANLGPERDLGVHWLTTPLPPRDLFCMLLADLVGVSLPRSCPSS